MRKPSLISLFLISISLFTVQAQKTFMKYGKVSEEELLMTEYAQDTSAGAVVLGDYGVTDFMYSADNGFDLKFTRHVRIKIFNKTELDWADFTISLYMSTSGKDEKLGSLKGMTFNIENGTVEKFKLKKDAIFREEKDKNHKLVKFSMPNVKEGSVIDVTYSITSPFIFTLKPWYFQKYIPVQRSEYNVAIPEYFNYKNWTSGYVPIKKESDKRKQTYQYSKGAEVTSEGRESGGIMNFEAEVTYWKYTSVNVPAFPDEPYITTANDYLGAVEFEIVSTKFPGSIIKYYTRAWKDINEDMMDDAEFGKQLDNTGHLKDQIELISQSESDPKARMIMAYEYIKKYMVWNNRYGKWPTSNIRRAYSDAGGNTADINLNLVALLKGLGLEANPVLVSTRKNGKLKPGQVILTQFNHVVASVDIEGEIFVLDAIDHYCPAYILPPNTLNDKGLMISQHGFKWIDLYSDLPSIHVLFLNTTINEDLEFEGSFQESHENYKALSTRKSIKNLANPDEYREKMEKSIEGLEISEFSIENLDSIYKPLQIKADITLADRITDGGDLFYFNPILSSKWDENPFKNDERKFPIDFNYPVETKYTSIINLPAGYAIEEVPEAMSISLPDGGGEFQYKIRAGGNQIVVNYNYSINQTIFPSLVYSDIKKFFELMVAKQAEQIVLKSIL